MSDISEKTDSTDSLFELLALRTIVAFSTAKVLRGGSRLLPQIAVGATTLLFGSYLWSSHFASRSLGPNYNRIVEWEAGESENGHVGGGLRVVVFGGGDIATPSRASWQIGGPNAGWTDILCLQLDCNTYLSYVPVADNDEGAVVSNSLFEAALARTSSLDNETLVGIDYSWIAKNYPVPSHQDLLHQVEAFLANPRPQQPPRETLWVFNVGFWDIWSLAALPRKLAMHLVETQAEHVFAQIELLYEEAHNNNSIAFSDYYAGTDMAPGHSEPTVKTTLPRAPFRVFIPRLFDISLTPGFEGARYKPPRPHTKAEQMRNAALLTQHWDKVINDMLSEWMHLPDPEEVNGENDDLSEIKDADLLFSKKSIKVGRASVPRARREAVTYDIFSYVRELIIERQLRNADLVDYDGLGLMAMADGYSDVREPCLKRDDTLTCDDVDASNEGAEDDDGWSVCNAPDEHLFWTEFTINRRAVFEVGKRAADLFSRHMQMDAEWSRKAHLQLPSLRESPEGVPLRAESFEA
ncbi:hypothetical protein F5Y06DRAFT_302752 [Hypoxylon sp. FL0890]|nr:hypothetical protein F5Y06DRAFT_302752 [Hypoxylon sp. FL0890]